MRTLITLLTALLLFAATGRAAADSSTDRRARLRSIYLGQLHVREATSKNDGAQVEAYLKAIYLPKGYAWCSAFVVWCRLQAGINAPRYGAARSWFTDKKRLVYNHGQGSASYGPPRTGDLVGYEWGRSAVSHVGFIDVWGTGSSCQTVEGNTSGGAQDRDGQGVYKNWRLKRQVAYVANWLD